MRQKNKSCCYLSDLILFVPDNRWESWSNCSDFILFVHIKKPDQPELYDLRVDPAEKQNVSHHFPQEVKQFQSSVDAHRLRVAESEPATAVQKVKVDEDVARRLRDLGYL